VLLESKPVYSCMVLAVDCKNKSVETLEGLSSEGKNQSSLQDAFVKVNASQCGFCTPGMVMSAKAILDRNLEPSRDEVKLALSGNICRCTDYSRYVDAVLVAAEEIRNKKVAKEKSVRNA
jgi:aerobic-type carbon monoxide dehydrogenase small subunit (CoxS/CutS family)